MKKSFYAIFAALSLVLCSCFTFVSADDGSATVNVPFFIFFSIYSVLLLVVMGIMIWLIIKERKSNVRDHDTKIDDEEKAEITFVIKDFTKGRMDVYFKSVALASNSPRRLQLLKPYFKNIKVCPLVMDETSEKIEPIEIAEDIAVRKMGNLSEKYFDRFTISADTIVAMDGKVYGKPKDAANAAEILSELSGKWHNVITGYCVCYKGLRRSGSDVSRVKFKSLTEEEIAEYIATGSPLDKAGAYGIQDNATVEVFEGNIDNVIGLPVDKILRVCAELIDEDIKNGKN